MYCIGTPIFNVRGQGVGACSISGNDPAIIQDRLVELSASVMATAQEISRRMGYVATSVSSLNTIIPSSDRAGSTNAVPGGGS